MNQNLNRWVQIAEKKARIILGLMSGTSGDGLDLAACRISGHGTSTKIALLHFFTQVYSPAQKKRLQELVSQENVSLKALTHAHQWLGRTHGEMVKTALQSWGLKTDDVDALASHGHTFYHAPAEKNGDTHATLQLGDGDHLAVTTGILTLSDFRQKEIAGGGQGAPLAPYVDQLLFQSPKITRVLINLGGIANFTILPAGEKGAITGGDTGPANTLMDRAMRRFFPQSGGFDKGGAVAREGQIHTELLTHWKAHPFFAQPLPKSTGPELFGATFLDEGLQKFPEISPEDTLTTLAHLSAETLGESVLHALKNYGIEAKNMAAKGKLEVFVSGGGTHNPVLINHLSQTLGNLSLADTAQAGVPSDAKEAMLFAVLANETLCGNGFSPPKAKTPLTFGKISFPG